MNVSLQKISELAIALQKMLGPEFAPQIQVALNDDDAIQMQQCMDGNVQFPVQPKDLRISLGNCCDFIDGPIKAVQYWFGRIFVRKLEIGYGEFETGDGSLEALIDELQEVVSIWCTPVSGGIATDDPRAVFGDKGPTPAALAIAAAQIRGLAASAAPDGQLQVRLNDMAQQMTATAMDWLIDGGITMPVAAS